MPRGSSLNRERQYEHIKDSELSRGEHQAGRSNMTKAQVERALAR
jgi:hypothetical protein